MKVNRRSPESASPLDSKGWVLGYVSTCAKQTEKREIAFVSAETANHQVVAIRAVQSQHI
jgi:hypothetical protein